jgi:hypothetical protein
MISRWVRLEAGDEEAGLEARVPVGVDMVLRARQGRVAARKTGGVERGALKSYISVRSYISYIY